MTKCPVRKLRFILLLCALPGYAGLGYAAQTYRLELPGLTVHLTPRTPQQVAAFYEARGFGRAMLEQIKQYCFITVYIKNTGREITWLDLTHWKFTRTNQAIQRLDRQQLKQRWQAMQVPLAHQSTFRWTLLPEQLDFQPNEREGGNIVLPSVNHSFAIQARFDTRADRSGKPIDIKLDNIQCKNDPS